MAVGVPLQQSIGERGEPHNKHRSKWDYSDREQAEVRESRFLTPSLFPILVRSTSKGNSQDNLIPSTLTNP